MPYRKVVFANKQYYHVFNRTISDEPVYSDKYSFNRALSLVDFYRVKSTISFSRYLNLSKSKKEEFNKATLASSKPLVEIFSFAFMPNHFHFLLKQLEGNGISRFISNFQNSLAKYYNLRKKRAGGLFCNMFKGVLVESEEQYIHLSRYIHLNPVTSYLIKLSELDNYPGTSFSTYMGKTNYEFINTQDILDLFNSKKDYRQFVYDQADYQKELDKIKKSVLEDFPGVQT